MAWIQGLAEKLRLVAAGPDHHHEVTLFTRSGCHLCEDAREVLERHGLQPRMVDIDADPELVRLYTECVPVVVIDGRERFRGRINEVLLRRILRHG